MADDGGVPDTALADLHQVIGERRDAMLDDLRALVECETPSDDLAALRAGHDLCIQLASALLGPPTTLTTTPGGAAGDVSVLEYDGAGTSPVVVLTHYDTVWPLGTLVSIPFSVTHDVITGPGVFDMKAGLIQALHAVAAVDRLGLPRPALRWVLNGDEEIGSPVSRGIIEQACEDAAAVLVFEASAGGALKTARKGVGLFDVTVTGIEAHAGLDPTAGASAITAATEVVASLVAAQDSAAGTTINVGTICGGTRPNVTAGACRLGIDVRIASQQEAARVDEVLAVLAPRDARVGVHVDGGWNRPAMERSTSIGALFQRCRALAARLGLELEETAVGGASDGNFAAALGRPVLDGLGAVGAGAHARDEHATVSGMVERTVLAAALLTDLSGPG